MQVKSLNVQLENVDLDLVSHREGVGLIIQGNNDALYGPSMVSVNITNKQAQWLALNLLARLTLKGGNDNG